MAEPRHAPEPRPIPGVTGRPLPAAFYDRPVLEVAPELLGCTVTHAGVSVRLTEVEAYDGERDPGSHAFAGRTPRVATMYGPPGGLYVYFTYGMHWCANLVCGPVGSAGAVLLRAGVVVGGIELARSRRGARADRELARGPARLTTALALGGEHDGVDTTGGGSVVVVRDPGPGTDPATLRARVRTGPRVGVSGPGGEATAYPWRFFLAGEPTVSTYRPGKPRVRRPRA